MLLGVVAAVPSSPEAVWHNTLHRSEHMEKFFPASAPRPHLKHKVWGGTVQK